MSHNTGMAEKKGYKQFCPVAKAAEILAERWTFLVLRELLCGSRRFNDMRKGLPMMSPSLLSTRLKELEQAKIIKRKTIAGEKSTTYVLTEAGEDLRPLVLGLGVWGLKWAHKKITKEDLDPGLLMWDMRRGILTEHMPAGRSVIEFNFGPREKKRLWWLVVTDDDVDICMKYPGFEIDLYVHTTMKTMSNVWLRVTDVPTALKNEKIRLEGSKQLVKSFPDWLGQSAIATATEENLLEHM